LDVKLTEDEFNRESLIFLLFGALLQCTDGSWCILC